MTAADVIAAAAGRDHLTNGLSFRKAAGLTVVRDWDESIGYVYCDRGQWHGFAYKRGGFMGDRAHTYAGAYTRRRDAANAVAAIMRGNARCGCVRCTNAGAA